ncbi:hypothetical protein TNIN_72021 [Trichonephila inaurata madagascariensis]|uniref:Uncharacterized protein n=1 Tax=Trichonephila inaurata madagascariensis TaxID=2747483 RepID=A0A8X7BPL0_9ARAC|nr:hypothetical protein TNIN_72021 [Trichonephila inaurata madagascariensis]
MENNSTKIVPCGSKVVEIAAFIAVGMFNEGTKSLLYFECIRTFIRHCSSCLCRRRACDDLQREKEKCHDDNTSWTLEATDNC